MNIIADTHTHTLACEHAYSTINENAAAAAGQGLRFLCMTEHAPELPSAPSISHFLNLRAIPHEINGVVILKGAEVNILDYKGHIDLRESLLDKLDWVIASMHTWTLEPGSREDHTGAWLAVAENPQIDVIGHCGDGRYPFDEGIVLPAFARNRKIVEINAHSFAGREGSAENCPRIARKCMELGIPIVVSSDAHHSSEVGRQDAAIRMLEEIGFPEERILNADAARFLKTAKDKAAAPMREYLETLSL